MKYGGYNWREAGAAIEPTLEQIVERTVRFLSTHCASAHTEVSSRLSKLQEVGQTAASCGGGQLADVKTTSARKRQPGAARRPTGSAGNSSESF